MAAMFAMQTPPGHRGTETAFFENRLTHGDDENDLDHQEAREHGVDTNGKVYVKGLSRHGLGPQDKKAWVSNTGEALKRAKELNVNLTGAINYTARPVEPAPDCPLAEKHIKAMMKRERIFNSSEFNKLSAQEKREHVIEKYGQKRAVKKWNEYQKKLKKKKATQVRGS